MKTQNEIEKLKNYLNLENNDNFIGYDYDPDTLIHYFKFTDMIYSTQIIFIVTLNVWFHIITIENNIYLAIRNF